jgi:LysM repeat protein
MREASGRHRPFTIGLLNGLMIACGPLQAMYVMAAGTGSAFEGAKMLFAFGLGTLPVLSAFGVLTTLISASLTHRLLKASGVIVVVLGAVMINRGLILTGSGYDLASLAASLRKSVDVSRQALAPPPTAMAPAPAAPASQTIRMEANRFGYSPKRFVLSKGVPVKWVIDGKGITNCNKRIVAPALNLEFDVKKGVQTIEFTPAKAGIILWSCWMGMLRGEFEVVEAPPALARQDGRAAPAPLPAETPERGKTHTIAAGDTLRRVAKTWCGDANRWPDIAAANPGLDPRRLRPGQIIELPAPAGGADW